MNNVTPVSLRIPLSVFNANSTLKEIHRRMYEHMYVRMLRLGYIFTPLYVRVTCHTHTTHTYKHTHTHVHTRTHIHTPHYNVFVHTALIQPNLSQRSAKTSELHGRIRSSELDPQSFVVLLCLVLFCPSVYVRKYVSVCSFVLFSFALLAGGRFSKLQNRAWVAPAPFLSPWLLVFACLFVSSGTRLPWLLVLKEIRRGRSRDAIRWLRMQLV